MTISNRTFERAQALRDELGDKRVRVADFADLAASFGAARLAILAVETPSPLLAKSHLALLTEPLLIVDLGVPRAVASDVDELAHVRRFDMGDLRERVERRSGRTS